MLKNPSVRIDYRVKNTDLLSMASLWDWKAVETELIHYDVSQVFALGMDGFNYLTRSAFNGRKSKVLRLLNLLKDHGERLRESVGEGKNPIRRRRSFVSMSKMYGYQSRILTRMPASSIANDEDSVFHHLLHLCAQQDWEDVSNILEDQFDIHGLPDGDHVGRTMLHWAVENSWDYALRDFSHKPKSWLDHQDRDGMTALHITCQLQNREVAEHLVDSGASYLLKNKLGRTPGS
jgi:hypothetical protein